MPTSVAERMSAFEVTQLGAEVTAGVKVPALKRLLCTSIVLDPEIPVTPYRPFGSVAPTDSNHQKEWTQGDYEGRGCFTDLLYLLSSCLCKPVITTPGGATLTRRWNFKPKTWAPDDVQTFTVEHGQSVSAERATYMLVNAFNIRLTQEEAAVSGSVLAQEPDFDARLSTNEVQRVNLGGATGGTFTLTFGGQVTPAQAFNVSTAVLQAALEALSTIGAGNVLVTTGGAGIYDVEFIGILGQTDVASMVLGSGSLTGATGPAITTPTAGVPPTDIPAITFDTDKVSVWTGAAVGSLAKLRRVKEIEWGISDRFAGNFNLDDDEPSFTNHVLGPSPGMAGQVTMQRDIDARTLLTYMRAKTTRIWRIQVIGPVIEGAFTYKFTLTWPVKYRDPRHDRGDTVATGQYELPNHYDSTFGGWVEAEIDCVQTAL